MLRRLLLFTVLVSSLIGSAAAQQGGRPFTFDDLMALKRIGDPQPSPDGKWVLFAVQEVNLEGNSKPNHLWIMPAAGGEARRLTNSAVNEDRGRFSPDGKWLIFTSQANGSSQIYVAAFDSERGALSGDPRQLTSLSTEADGGIWTGDGKNIVFLSEVYPDCDGKPDPDACNKARDEEQAKSKVKAKVFTRLFYRHWSSFTRFKRSHLFVVPMEGGAAKDLTPGDHDVPPFSLGGQDMYDSSPDGQELAYTSNIDEVEATSTNNEIFTVPITGGTPKKISTSPGSDSTPLYSPDGKWIAWRMQKRNGYESDRFRLVIYDRQAGAIKNLTEDFDRWVGTIAWTPDSQNIWFNAEDQGESPIYAMAASGGKPMKMIEGHNDDLIISHDGKALFFTRMTYASPNEIYSVAMPANGARAMSPNTSAKALTHLNDAVLGQVNMPKMESFWFTGAENTKVEGFLIRPPQFEAGKKYPVKFLIHGGPQGAMGDSWSYRWNGELFAANGYVVVMINPRGSTGYGQRFIDEINGDWGGRPYVDLMRGLDYAETKFPFIDKGRECAMGASYGGYMINWILGHTDRFRCLVSHDGMFNTESAYGDTEELWFNEWEFKGTPWTNRETYRRWSPHLFATSFKTPTLVVHSQLDYRLDVSQGFDLFTTLQRLKVPSKMLYFPDEGHWVLKPQNSQLWYKTVNGWVDEYTSGEGGAAKPQPAGRRAGSAAPKKPAGAKPKGQ
jgi:dipeptidyl aminopeptidase/acylaminoacyl peptidase